MKSASFGRVGLVLALMGCNGSASPSQRRGDPGVTPAVPDRTAPSAGAIATTDAGVESSPQPALADRPIIDLVDNRFRFHLYPSGLLVPLASPGLAKYTQEYSQPWGDLAWVDDRPGRVLRNDRATLRVMWDAAEVGVVRLRVHGVAARQRVIVEVNGKRAGVAPVPASWSIVTVPIPAGLLRAGDNQIRLRMSRVGRWQGKKTYGLFHSLELAHGVAGETTEWPRLSPAAAVTIAGQRQAALTGFGRMTMNLEIPAQAWLRVDTGVIAGRPRFRVRVLDDSGPPRTLLEVADQRPGWQRNQISLGELADRLVTLEWTVDGDVAGAAWGSPQIALETVAETPRPPPYDNAILVVVDALRSDRLALYGDTRVVTPRITAQARGRGVVFRRNQAASPSSPPAHSSIQTGMTPRVHGVCCDQSVLAKGTPMLSTQLRDAGIEVAYFGNNNFAMGRLEKPGRWSAFHEPVFEGKGADCQALVTELLSFAAEKVAAKQRFVVSALPMEPHVPYRFHPGITDSYFAGPWPKPVGKRVTGDLLGAISAGRVRLDDAGWRQLTALYDGEVSYFDGCFGTLVDGLDALGIASRTAVILASDHGEGMYEHRRMGHAYGHYFELGDVPLVIYGDGLVDRLTVIDTVTSQLDIAPTLLDLVGVVADPRVQGRTLIPLIQRAGSWPPRVVPLEYGRSYGLRARDLKYIVDYSGNESLFDLATDPTEQQPLGDRRPRVLGYLRELAGFYLAYRKSWRMATWGPLNDHGPGFIEFVGATELPEIPAQIAR